MKKFYKTLLVAATGILGFSASAQVSTYVFSQLQGNYTAISGGTVFGTTTTDDDVFTDPANPANSNVTGVGIPIGFNFTFDAIVYDRFGINNNGWIGFGQSALTPAVDLTNNGASNYQAISTNYGTGAIYQRRVAGLSRDLQAQSGGPRVETIGTAPNRICVIQWSNYKKWNNTGDDLHFQIRLYETSNRVEVIYGTVINNATVLSAEVGLRGASSADYNNRSVTTANTWASSVPGTANTAVANINNIGLSPNSGQIYRWDAPVPCTGAPALSNAVSFFTMVCPSGSTGLSISNTYTNTGITYQWYHSNASAVGPYTLIATPSATNPAYSATNITTPMWYQVVVTCSAGPTSATMTPASVGIQGTTIDNVPYYEDFEGIIQNNQLPNCSWSRSNIQTTLTYTSVNANNRIPHSGNKFASFRYGTNATGDYFYTNGIQLEPGITYSAAVWYTTDGAMGWSELSLNYGTTQGSAGLTAIASVTGAVSGTFYQQLGNTFTVPNSGIYYIAIKGIGNSSPLYMSFDDLSVTIPCSLNSPTITLVNSPIIACSGQSLNISANGADTYSWSTGDQTPSINFTPYSNMNITVMGTSSLSGCTTTLSQMLNVNFSPGVSIFPTLNAYSVCAGSTATLNAVGATSYTWSNGNFAASTTVAPSSSTTYTVLGSNGSGCIGSAVFQLGINTLPSVSATSEPTEICVGETAVLTGAGALTYQWKANSIVILTSPAEVSPNASVTYTLVGTDANGCSGTSLITLEVNACVGLNELTAGLSDLKVYPNPTNSNFTVELNNGLDKQIEVVDVTGRVILTNTSSDEKVNVNVQNLAAGIYYVKVKSGNAIEIIKVVKN